MQVAKSEVATLVRMYCRTIVRISDALQELRTSDEWLVSPSNSGYCGTDQTSTTSKMLNLM